jgi:hypothetical protein
MSVSVSVISHSSFQPVMIRKSCFKEFVCEKLTWGRYDRDSIDVRFRRWERFQMWIFLLTSDWLQGGRSRDQIPVGARFSAPVQTGPGGLSNLLYNGYRVIPGGKAAEAWRWPPTPSSAEVKERMELYPYSPSGPSWPILVRNLPLPFIRTCVHIHTSTYIRTYIHVYIHIHTQM